jgi:UDP-glucose 4-epimerase
VDNLNNSSEEALRRVEQITGSSVPFYNLTVQDGPTLRAVFEQHSFDAIIHFAGYKAVGESVEQPLKYYTNNIDSTLVLMKVAQEFGVNKIIFSSSATVYGDSTELPLKETSQTGIGITNPYGRTKYMLEEILRDIATANPALEVTLLRYFNPVGAHESGLIGEDPNGAPQNLLPFVSQVAVGKREKVFVFGDDYETVDGTGMRDYIHVVDLARGHVAALEHSQPGTHIYNLATGRGTSVLELIHAFETACGKQIPYEIVERRPGDVASSYADPTLAKQALGWTAQYTIDDICASSWKWQSQNPDGYK